MVIYLLKSVACLGILLLVYLLFLEKEKMHHFNRWYLIGSIVFSLIVPSVSFTVSPESLPLLQRNYFVLWTEPAQTATSQPVVSPAAGFSLGDYVVPMAVSVYVLVTLLLLGRFARNFYRVLSNAFKNKTIAYCGAHLVLMKERTASYSFLHYIFISEDEYANNEIEQEIITHELTHVHQKHSWDVIFIELLQAVLWFNPLFIFYKKAIQLNHEYLADEAVIRTYADVPAYQLLLLDKTSCESCSHFTSNFNYSVTKKRLIMMSKAYNNATALLKKLALIPVLCFILVIFSAKEILAQASKQKKVKAEKKTEEMAAPMLVPGMAYPPGQGASSEELAEYNAIIDKNLGVVTKNGHKTVPHVTSEERGKMLAIYKRMNNAQRSEARALFTKKPTPKAPKHPSPEQFEEFKNSDLYGVWIGSRKINNEELNNYKAEDFGRFDISNLYYTQKMKENVMKMFNLKKMYKYQVNLYKTADAERDYQRELASPPEYLLFQVDSKNKHKVMIAVN